MKSKNNKTRKIEIYTYEEYQKRYFPKTKSSKLTLIDNPKEFGTTLARASLNKLDKALSVLHQK
jgi:hypothetical protein